MSLMKALKSAEGRRKTYPKRSDFPEVRGSVDRTFHSEFRQVHKSEVYLLTLSGLLAQENRSDGQDRLIS